METTNTNIKIVRLQSGEDIIASYFPDEEEGTVQLDNPMHMIFKRLPSGTMMMMLPWLPVELIEKNSAVIYSSDILTVIDPKVDLIKHYATSVSELMKRMEEGLLEEEDDEDDNETLRSEDMIEILNNFKSKKLH